MTTSHQTVDQAAADRHESTVVSEAAAGLERIRSEFAFIARGAYNIVVPLFGAHAERVWAGDYWKPRFLYPDPVADVPGMVFATHQSDLHATWVNTAFDLEAGHIQYVYFVPETLVTMIDIQVSRQGAYHAAVYVTYTRTALRPEANDKVREMAEIDRNAGEEWQGAINGWLSRRPNRD